MKLAEIIAKIDKSPEFAEQVYIAEISGSEFNLDIQFWGEQNRLVAYYIACWHCTDSKVGYKAYLLDDKLVAVSHQSGRKSSENFAWTSKADYQLVREFIKTFDTDEDDFTPDILDLEEEFGDFYKIVYYEQMYDFHKENAIYKGQPVEVIGKINSHRIQNGEYIPEHCQIKVPNMLSPVLVKTDELDFKYNLNRKNTRKNLFNPK